MITYLTYEDIDKTRWDECIAHAPNGNVYAWSWYLDVVHPKWDALVEMTDDKYLSVMPIAKKVKYGIHYFFQPFFVQQLGVFSVEPITETKVLEFLKAIPVRYRLVDFRLNEGNPLSEGYDGVEYHLNHLLDLNADYESLSYKYHLNTKRNLKKSLNYNLRLVKDVSIQEVIDLFRSNRGSAVKHWGDTEYARLNQLSEVALSSSNAFIYGVKTFDNENIICGALFLISHHRITFLFSGNNAVGKQTQAMTFLINQVIHEYAGKPLTFDFEGSDDLNLARFYRGFDSVPVTYPGLKYRYRNPLR